MIETLLDGLWGVWVLTWLGAALWASRPEKRVSVREEAVYRILTIIAAILIFWHFGRDGAGVLWTTPAATGWIFIAVTAMGLGFTWWARLHLGLLWSGNVTRKADHRVIDSGPYGIVRHPIYTGLLLALYATALQHGTSFAVAGAVVATVGFYIKARLEERFLTAELAADAYAGYRARVPMLVPFWPARG